MHRVKHWATTGVAGSWQVSDHAITLLVRNLPAYKDQLLRVAQANSIVFIACITENFPFTAVSFMFWPISALRILRMSTRCGLCRTLIVGTTMKWYLAKGFNIILPDSTNLNVFEFYPMFGNKSCAMQQWQTTKKSS